MKLIVSFLASGMLTNSAIHLVRIFQYQPGEPQAGTPFWGDITDLATGGSDGFYDVGDWRIQTLEELTSWLLDYFANANDSQILTPIHDPHHILATYDFR